MIDLYHKVKSVAESLTIEVFFLVQIISGSSSEQFYSVTCCFTFEDWNKIAIECDISHSSYTYGTSSCLVGRRLSAVRQVNRQWIMTYILCQTQIGKTCFARRRAGKLMDYIQTCLCASAIESNISINVLNELIYKLCVGRESASEEWKLAHSDQQNSSRHNLYLT